MALVPAYDKNTGEVLPNLVPEHWFEHPTLGAGIMREPRPKPQAKPADPTKKEN